MVVGAGRDKVQAAERTYRSWNLSQWRSSAALCTTLWDCLGEAMDGSDPFTSTTPCPQRRPTRRAFGHIRALTDRIRPGPAASAPAQSYHHHVWREGGSKLCGVSHAAACGPDWRTTGIAARSGEQAPGPAAARHQRRRALHTPLVLPSTPPAPCDQRIASHALPHRAAGWESETGSPSAAGGPRGSHSADTTARPTRRYEALPRWRAARAAP